MHRSTAICFTVAALLLTSVAMAHETGEHAAKGSQTKQAAAHVHQSSTEQDARVGDVYPLLTDPVTDEPLAKVKEPVEVIYQGRSLHFANKANAETFNKHPGKYLAKVDAKIIEQQKASYPMTTCVTSGEKFGGDMGEPIDMVYGNRLVRFCCSGCIADFKKDPAKYLAKIDAAALEASKKNPPKEGVCPVSGDQFGGDMGEPVNYLFAGRVIKLCCKGCVKDFEKNPAKYLAQMDQPEQAPAKTDSKKSDHHNHDHH